MEAILTDCVQNSLRQFMHHNAIFMCERLCAEFPSEINLQLLAVCYLQSNQAYSAYHVLKGQNMAQSRYLFALSCFKMDLLYEAEKALYPPNEPTAEVPNGAAGHYLLGLIYRYTDRRERASQHFTQALSLDPLLWAAYEELCILGDAEDATRVFGDAASVCVQKQHMTHESALQSLRSSTNYQFVNASKNFGSEDVSPRPMKHMHSNNQRVISANHHGLSQTGGTGSQSLNGPNAVCLYNTPSPMTTITQLSGVAPPPLCRGLHINGPNHRALGADSSPRSTLNATIPAPRRKFVDEGKLRKVSERLFTDSGSRRSTRLASREDVAYLNSSVSTISGNGTNHSSKFLGSSKLTSASSRKVTGHNGQSWADENFDEGTKHDVYDDTHISSITSSSTSSEPRSVEQEGPTASVGGVCINASRISAGASELLALLQILGEGYRLFCVYRCQDALDVYMKLPQKQYNTGWVLSQVGKAYFELLDYVEADHAFSLARLASPHSLEGMDIYSTVLYHLKEDMKLSYLAQELISTDRLAPQSWCALGNCYSLQKCHETALKNFQRAVKLDSRFAYAHTLCGHEYVAMEDFENGINSYQCALRLDARHYNARYGLGMIYLRQENFFFAAHYFRMALEVNPRSSVIMSYLGTALHALGAKIHLSMEKYEGALEALEKLKDDVPQESSVYALMGRIYRRLHMCDKAMLHYGIALDMKPPATDVATIKAAIERLRVADELSDD
ncbi:OLC1v1005662C2 [Oldenlandia corymbosa var. corymbosa]|uniref:OLC1v1005662C2 n=1 Tax=Oldenlandia corymbosa var. corymbosa TaxID=529605 RepID=A0AAV1DF77_OLDCO|nr:OLC1v1005662C2 [Oldenlandia corymbosa var. corymbosa]